ncbi:hypothetical protein O1Q96_22535 [Streptomyces sp. Qhu-G9]|uniref:hypothetical protein n=1 Tax=Streptomyces sp. Qhu-G9 TaxID=3452799 RepID=UPI0022AC1787|nr:hypothetical protein [Streptomyces aurantiacus]WAU82288.1 hypothetical protein O1Q96_22535 [Streptomyces aurantiacus]
MPRRTAVRPDPGRRCRAALLALARCRGADVRRGLPAYTPDVAAEGAAALNPGARSRPHPRYLTPVPAIPPARAAAQGNTDGIIGAP